MIDNVAMMKKNALRTIILFAFALMLQGIYSEDKNFNDGWLFYNAEADNAGMVDFDDSHWRQVDLPHDWAIEGPFDPKYNSRCGGLPFHGTGWYRKHFTVADEARGKVVRIEFEGAMYNAHVWVNGQLVGNRPYGYIGFEFDISTYLHYGEENLVAVRLTPEDLSSRWYPGAGIYRSVWLKMDNPVHIVQWGTYVTTPTITTDKAVVQNETEIVNKSERAETISLKHEYFSPKGEIVASIEEHITLAPNTTEKIGLWVNIEKPMLWDLETPNLYNLLTTITQEGKLLDQYKTRFGIRSISYDEDGFYLNGRLVRFNGVCLHHDNGALGAAVYRRADERKLQIMKDMGVNAIRTSHNPPSRELLELCDEMGLMVQDEAFDVWRMPKVPNGYNLFYDEWSERDIKSMVKRDRNHPSIVMWSIGNEIREQGDKLHGWEEAKRLVEFTKEMDPTRPVTAGFNHYPAPFNYNMAQQLDIVGMNYKAPRYGEVHENYPHIPVYGSETSSCTSSRGVYHLPLELYKKSSDKQISSYDLIAPPWAYPPDIEFHFLEKYPHSMGEFVWTGFDYLGEPTPYGGMDNATDGYWNDDWPARSSYFGAVDLCGFPKDRFYLYQSQWTTEPMIHLLPHWNWEGREGEMIPVYCYTNCDEAELFVNGKSLGKKVKGVDKTELFVKVNAFAPDTFMSKYRLSWLVPYKRGSIRVVGYKNGRSVQEKEIRTAGKPARVRLSVDRSSIHADGRDLAYVTVRIEDKHGNLCPLADNLVNFEISGAGSIVGVDNGNAATVEPFQASYRKAFNGMCLAIIRSDKQGGSITLKAKSRRLMSAKLELSADQK